MYFSVAFIKRGFKLPPSISVEAQFRDLMKYLKRDITDKTDPEAPTENRAKALFRYLAVKEFSSIKMKQKIKKIGTAAALHCSQVYFGS